MVVLQSHASFQETHAQDETATRACATPSALREPIHRHVSLHPIHGTLTISATHTSGLNEEEPLVFGMVAGAGFGIVSTVCGYPFDLIKTRLQTGHSNNAREAILDVYRREGIRGFYRGLMSPLLGAIASRSLLFTVASSTKAFCNDQDCLVSEIPLTGGMRPAILMSALVFGSTRAVAETTFELFKVQAMIHSSAWLHSHRLHWLSTGVNTTASMQRLFQGFTPNLIRSVVGLGTFYVVADSLDRHLPDLIQMPFYGAFCKGAVSGTLATTASFPLDAVKSIRQADTSTRKTRFATFSVLRQLYRERGFCRGLYRGYLPGAARAFLANGFAMVAFTTIVDWQHHHWE